MSDVPTPPAPPPPPEPPHYGQAYYPPAQPAAPPAHDHASLALGLGLAGLLGSVFCIGPLASPFAIGFGISARRAIRREPGRWGGEGMATAGIVLGIIGVVLLVVIVLIGLGVAVAFMNGTIDTSTSTGVST
ncbi:MAG TPA: DUF4190 domain-containing protein [Marmoricola sp.]